MTATHFLANPTLGLFALEAREDFETFEELPWDEYPNHWFFLLQSLLACSHLTDVQHCSLDSVEYAGGHNGRHVWLGHS